VRQQRPNLKIILPRICAYHWGGLLFFFEMATAFEAELLKINAFDQPGVEGYKNYMYYKLGKSGIPKETVQEIKKFPLLSKRSLIL
jgi:glucose-6-phosphate isomerase